MAKHVLALIGAGGKTTAMGLLARQSGEKAVLVTTTTHIYPLEGMERLEEGQLLAALNRGGSFCAGSQAADGKLGMLPAKVLEPAIEAADLVVYEADGAHRLPLKLHKPGEPVVLPQTSRCLILAGLSALGQPIGKIIHRSERNPGWNLEKSAGVEELVHCVLEAAEASGLPREKIKVFLNQADALGNPAAAMDAAQLLRFQGLDTRYGSLREAPELYAWLTEG